MLVNMTDEELNKLFDLLNNSEVGLEPVVLKLLDQIERELASRGL